jgi:hypothetical protein
MDLERMADLLRPDSNPSSRDKKPVLAIEGLDLTQQDWRRVPHMWLGPEGEPNHPFWNIVTKLGEENWKKFSYGLYGLALNNVSSG